MSSEEIKLKRKRLRVMTFYKDKWPVPYVVFAFQIPTKVVYPQPEQAVVLCREPSIGHYLQSDLNGEATPYIDFLPYGKVTPGTRCYTKMIRVRMNIAHLEHEDEEGDEDPPTCDDQPKKPGRKARSKAQKLVIDWNLNAQRIVLMERGVVFGIVESNLRNETLWVMCDGEHPIRLRGAFEST